MRRVFDSIPARIKTNLPSVQHESGRRGDNNIHGAKTFLIDDNTFLTKLKKYGLDTQAGVFSTYAAPGSEGRQDTYTDDLVNTRLSSRIC